MTRKRKIRSTKTVTNEYRLDRHHPSTGFGDGPNVLSATFFTEHKQTDLVLTRERNLWCAAPRIRIDAEEWAQLLEAVKEMGWPE